MEEITTIETSKKRSGKKNVSLNDSTLIRVKSCFWGKLYYKNPTTGELIIWEKQGDIQIMSMGDLRAMKARQVAFFKNQWILILGVAEGEDEGISPDDIYNALIIKQYYQNYIDISHIEQVCRWSDKEITERIPLLSTAAKENLIIALNKCIANGTLDSIKKIKSFEDALGCDLTYKN